LISAAGLLVLAAVAGIATYAPRQKHAVGLDGLAPSLDDEAWEVETTARTQLRIAKAAREANRRMARFLLAGIVLEIAGIACITWAVIALIGGA
jgi:hypothetical protein